MFVISKCLVFLRLQILKTMTLNPQHITLLRQLVSDVSNHRLETTTDFTFLAGEIYGRVKERLSVSTLKRLWGYVEGYASVRPATLDILARFAGFSDYETFVADYCEVEGVQSSHRVTGNSIYAHDLKVGDTLEITWSPNRRCLVTYQGDSVFVVTEAKNSKLKLGDRFLCDRFTLNEPLYVEYLMQDNKKELFVVGNKGGLTTLHRL